MTFLSLISNLATFILSSKNEKKKQTTTDAANNSLGGSMGIRIFQAAATTKSRGIIFGSFIYIFLFGGTTW